MDRAALEQQCPDCERPIVAGLDANRMALPARVDHIPLSPLGERYARAAGLWTYTLHRRKAWTEIDYREMFEYWPRAGSVVPQHHCHRALKIDRRLRA